MTIENVKALSDNELAQAIAWAQEEIRARTEKRKQETIAKIKALAAQEGITVAIGGVRGRPVKGRAEKADIRNAG
jgi:hypothetical protein